MRSKLNCLLWLNRSKTNKDGMAPIYVRITNDGRKVEISTGYFVNPAHWNTKKHSIKPTAEHSNKINDELKSLLLKISKIYDELADSNKPFSLEEIKSKLTNKNTKQTSLMAAIKYHNSLIEKGIGKNYATNTHKGYLWFADKVEDFIKHQYNRRDILLTELNHRFLTEFEHYLFHTLNNQVNTAQKNITQLKKVINLCIDLDWLDKMPFKRLKFKAYTPEREYLTIGELKAIELKEIESTRLQIIRDKFVFQCYTGVAFVDLNKLTANNIVKGVDGDDWIVLHREKTNSRSTIPLLNNVKIIIAKYDNPDRATLFPICSNQKFNQYLKELSRLCEINKRITSHTGRRTFATTVTLSNGVPIETVSRMLGHSDLKTTSIYAKVVDTKVSEDMQRVKSKLKDSD